MTKWPDHDEAFLDVVQKIRAALPKTTKPATGARISEPPAISINVAGPRSSNLRVKRAFTDADRDAFIDDAFEHIALFFENSLKELQERNPGIEGRFKRIDARSFVATIYRNGTEVCRCAIAHGTSMGFGQAISYARDERTIGRGFNELLSVEADEQSLFLKPMGIGVMASPARRQSDHLSVEGAAEYYWEMLMAPLQG